MGTLFFLRKEVSSGSQKAGETGFVERGDFRPGARHISASWRAVEGVFGKVCSNARSVLWLIHIRHGSSGHNLCSVPNFMPFFFMALH